jgi:hypothetical protein
MDTERITLSREEAAKLHRQYQEHLTEVERAVLAGRLNG